MRDMIRVIAMVAVTALTTQASAAGPSSEDAPAARTIVLVRHGQYDPDPKADPKLGPHLSNLGVAQASLAAARLAGSEVPFDALFASPVQRARDTAAIIAASMPGRIFNVLDDLAECTPPTRRKDVMAEEKPADLAACKAQLDRLFATAFVPARGAERTEMMVCHGNVTRYLVTRALNVDPMAWLEMSVGHASITTIRIEADGSMRVIAVGDVGHIPPNLRTGAKGDPKRSLAIPELPTAAVVN